MEALVAPTVARLSAQMAELGGRVQAAADLSLLMASRVAPQNDLSAFVIAEGLEPRPNDRGTGAHNQIVARRVGVVLFLRGTGPAGERIVDLAEALTFGVVVALAGWVPPGAMSDPMEFRGARQTSAKDGLFAYLIQFSARDLLRVIPT